MFYAAAVASGNSRPANSATEIFKCENKNGDGGRRSNVNSRIDSRALDSRLNLGLGRRVLNTDSERIAPEMRRISFGSLSILMLEIMMAGIFRGLCCSQ